MRISFNLIGCGIGNNGGSQTIIESANTLQELGCDVTIVDGSKNYNTWNPIKCNHMIIKSLKDFPHGDVVIATGYKTVDSTIRLEKKCGKKVHWIRGLEIWNYNEHEIFNKILKNDLKKIVNSICLQRKLLQFDLKSEIIRPGHNFNDFYPLDIRNDNDIIIGGLYNEGSKRSKKRTEWIFQIYEKIKSKYNIKLWMFGSDGTPKFHIDKYFKNPDIKTKNEIYNKIDIWLSPSSLEGLHIPPAEEMLTKGCVIGTNAEMSGTEDYLHHNKTGIVSKNEFYSFLDCVMRLIENKDLRNYYGQNGRKMILSLGDRKENMTKFIEFLKK